MTELSTDALENELLGLAGHIAAAQARFLLLLAEFDRRAGWAGPGLRSCAHWLSWRAGMSLRTATEHVRVAHALTRLPKIAAAFTAGRISYSKVRAITRIAAGEPEPDRGSTAPAPRRPPAVTPEPGAITPACAGQGQEENASRAVGPGPDSSDLRTADPGRSDPAIEDPAETAAELGSSGPRTENPAQTAAATSARTGKDTEQVLLDLALAGTASHVERVVRAARRLGADPAAVTAQRGVSWRWADDGSLVLRARLDPEAGVAVIAALEARADAGALPSRHDDPAAPPDWRERAVEHAPGVATDRRAARRADALVEMLTAADAQRHGEHDASSTTAPGGVPVGNAGGTSVDASAPDRDGCAATVMRGTAQVIVHVDAATGTAALAGGPELPPATAERLACDARAQVLLSDRRTNRMYLGRNRRLASPAQIAALTVRDSGRCQFPGCSHARWLHAHHVRSWLHGGRTDLDNLVLLCAFHHKLVHDRGYRIVAATGDHGRWTFTRPDGTPIPTAGLPLTGRTESLIETHAREQLHITGTTLTPTWGGERLDVTPILQRLLPEEEAAAA